jgi:hypothetical protein
VEDDMIDGLRVTMTGDDLRKLLEERMGHHRRSAERWKKERARTAGDQTDDAPPVPEQICENEEDRHLWRAEVLAFIRDHVEVKELYRLAESDLAFAELLPEKPGWLEQDEWEERNRIGFNLERLTREIRSLSLRTDSPAGHPRERRVRKTHGAVGSLGRKHRRAVE